MSRNDCERWLIDESALIYDDAKRTKREGCSNVRRGRHVDVGEEVAGACSIEVVCLFAKEGLGGGKKYNYVRVSEEKQGKAIVSA